MSTSESWPGVELLAEPTRRAVYEAVRRADQPLTRDEVAAAVGITNRLATFHLERLTDGGLLAFDFARPPGAGGPGAGRPAKRYWPADVRLSLAIPARKFELAARILASAVADASPSVTDTAAKKAAKIGVDVGRSYAAACGHLDEESQVSGCLGDVGYEPVRRSEGIALRNCPFHEVVDSARHVVCAMNLALVRGTLRGLGARAWAAKQVPAPPGCCVAVTPRRS